MSGPGRTVRRWSAPGMLSLLLLLGGVETAPAAHTQFWELSGYESFLAGTMRGLSLTEDGVLLLAPDLVSIPLEVSGLAPQPFLWRAALDGKGNLYLGSGIRGLVYRVTPRGEVSRFFTAPEIEVHALALDSKDRLLVGASPPARVYRVEPDGGAEIFFEPEERYVWDLAVGPRDDLFVATGEQGLLYRVDRKGDAEVLFDSDEPHLVSLGVAPDGTLIAGSAGSAVVFRIGPDGSATVLLDADGDEVAEVALAPDGTVFAAINQVLPPEEKPTRQGRKDEAKERLSGELPAAATPAPRGLEELAREPEEALLRAPPKVLLKLRSSLYRIPPAGPITRLWDAPEEGIHSLMANGDDRIYVGTGVPGRIYLVEGEEPSARLLARFDESQITALAGGRDRPLFAVTSNPGRLYRAAEDHGHSGESLSRIQNAGAEARWGRIAWDAWAPAGTRVEVSTRTGNSSRPDNTWSGWSEPYNRSEGSPITSPSARYLQVRTRGSPITSPSARYLQVRTRLSRLGDAASPRLRSVAISFREENLPPEVTGVTVAAPKPEEGDTPGGGPAAEPEGTPRSLEVTWKGSDPNGDALRYDLLFRLEPPVVDGRPGGEWQELARGTDRAPFPWDTSRVPGGRYRVQVRASDAPDNDEETSLTASAISDPFIIDQEPPRIRVLSASGEGGTVRISLQVSDAVSPVVRADYAVDDDGARHRLSAADGMDDGLEERYELSIPGLAPGSHEIHLSARDRVGNRAALPIPVEVRR